MKKILIFLSVFIVAALACDLSVNITPSNEKVSLPTNTTSQVAVYPTQIPPTSVPYVTATQNPAVPTNTQKIVAPTAVPTHIPATATSIPTLVPPTERISDNAGVQVSVGPLSVVLPSKMTLGARGTLIPRADDPSLAYWDKTPGHAVLKLEGYRLQGKTHQPEIYVYPALEYAQLVPSAFESLHRLDNILYGPNPNAPIGLDELPIVPFFNARQVFASNIQVVSFQNGSGVRFLTEYAQYPASANNQDLFYHFEGVTRDGAYYIIAILPISNPSLPETSDAGAPLPPGGIPYPFFANPEADMQAYYDAVTLSLNNASHGAFTPSIDQLDAMIQSIRVRD